jgi:hypothetical protein
MQRKSADRQEITRFAQALFRYGVGSGTYASLRAFDQFRRDVPPYLIRSVRIDSDLSPLIDQAIREADRCANAKQPVVFAPPLCTFTNDRRARVQDLACGLVLSVELDEGDMIAARARLEGLLGPATVIVASGGEWLHPYSGKTFPKLHLHWRLSEPSSTKEDHAELRLARDMAARLVGADPTGKPVVHPLRWPGSWNNKATPVMARIVTCNEAAEINLVDAVTVLSEAIELAGWTEVELPQSGPPQAAIELLQSATDVLPNADAHYDDWIRLGYAYWRATGGTDAGRNLWDKWSRKSAKFNASEQEAAWKRIGKAIEGSKPPKTIGAGTIFYLASLHGWKRPHERPKVNRVEALIAEFNAKYAVVNEAGKAIIFQKAYDTRLHREYFVRTSFDDLRRLYLNRRIQVGEDEDGKPVTKPVAEVWLYHPRRRQFVGGVVFDPSGKHISDDILHLWRGFAIVPKAGSWSKMKEHLLCTVCKRNQPHYEFLLDWSARLVQLPAEPGEVAIVLKGGEGVGKGSSPERFATSSAVTGWRSATPST